MKIRQANPRHLRRAATSLGALVSLLCALTANATTLYMHCESADRDCSSNGMSLICTMSVQNLQCANAAASGGYCTQDFELTYANCNGELGYEDAQLFLMGYEAQYMGGEHPIYNFYLEIEKVGFSPAGYSNSSPAEVGGKIAGRIKYGIRYASSTSDEETFSVYFQALMTNPGYASAKTATTGCSDNSTAQGCIGSTNLNGFVNSGETFRGFALSKIDITADDSGAGVNPAVLSVDVRSYSVAGSDVEIRPECRLDDDSNLINLTCNLGVVGVAGTSNETATYNHDAVTLTGGDANAPYHLTDYYDDLNPRTNPVFYLCGLQRFTLTRLYTHITPPNPVWSWWAGANTDCGTGQDPESYHVFGLLGGFSDVHPYPGLGVPFPAYGLWPGYSDYQTDTTFLGTEFW